MPYCGICACGRLPGTGTTSGIQRAHLLKTLLIFSFPDAQDSRKLQFKYHTTAPATGRNGWEADDFTRRPFLTSPTEIWTFESSPRILYQNPCPSGVIFRRGDALAVHLITQNAFRSGRLYMWNPYDPNVQPAYFSEAARDDANGVSTFNITLTEWMTSGFNLKLMQPAANDQGAVWEPDASNRVWRPSDGASLWLKSGQCDVRRTPLALTPVVLEVLFSGQLSDPGCRCSARRSWWFCWRDRHLTRPA